METAFLVGLLYALFTIGLSLSFRVLNYPDLTLEGSVILGGSISFSALNAGLDPISAIFIGALFGGIAGLFTAIQHLYLGVSKLLSGIITTTILYSVNIRILGGKSNVRLDDNIKGFFELFNPSHDRYIAILLLSAIIFVVIAFCVVLFSTKLGLLIRTLGDNESFVVSLGQNPKVITLIGLVISNSIIGLGGAILVQYKNTCDMNMSFGLLVSALAAMVIGETFLSAKSIHWHMIGSVLGTILYNFTIALVLFSWSRNWEKIVTASDVRLVSGLLLLIPIFFKMKKSKTFKLFRSEW